MPRNDIVFMGIYGAVGWFLALLLIRFLGPVMFDQGLLHLIFIVIGAAISWPTIWIAARLIDRPAHDMLAPTAVFTGAAACCDGIALSFAPWAYGPEGLHTGFAGGTILFGVGWLLFAALLEGRKAPVVP